MSSMTKKLMHNAREKGAVRESSEYFSVTDKRTVDLGNGQTEEIRVPNGQHRMKIISEKMGKGKGFDGKEQDELQMVVLDNGKQKLWNVAIKNRETGKVSYIIEALEDIETNEEFIAEAFKMKTGKYGVRISKVVAGVVPTIQIDDDSSEEASSDDEDGEDIPEEELPF